MSDFMVLTGNQPMGNRTAEAFAARQSNSQASTGFVVVLKQMFAATPLGLVINAARENRK